MKTFLRTHRSLFILALGLLIAGVTAGLVWARQPAALPTQTSPLHPTFALLDDQGVNVLESGRAVSTMQTCGQCHDTAFIVSHNFHADLGLSAYQAKDGSWDASTGDFGKWNPLTYRYLSQNGDSRTDLTTPEWLMRFGERVPGGGPATTSRDGRPLTSLSPNASNPETSVLDPKTGKTSAWDWQKSGVMELNCFLCHLEQPDLKARATEIHAGNFGWANTATLQTLGLVNKLDGTWVYNPDAFDENGKLKAEFIKIQDPTNANCAACHGAVHTNNETPLTYTGVSLENYQTATTGQLISPQKISLSGMNIQGKSDMNYAFDIHAERALKCTDCHYSLNNPAQAQRLAQSNPAHLVYDPRRLEIGEYLQRPDHNFARGQSAQFNVDPALKGTMRRCDSCHNAEKAHSAWLPYWDRHMAVLDCETCHIPKMVAPAIQAYDWTVITPDGQPLAQYRGVQGDPNSIESLITGFQPVLLQRTNVDGHKSLTTYNLITAWYWVYDDPSGNPRPVRLLDLQTVYLQNGRYAPDVVKAFDADGDGKLSESELRLDNESKVSFVRGKLEALGLKNPRIEGQVMPFSINHNVVAGKATVSDCRTCHNTDSRVTAPMTLSTYLPGGVMPAFASETNVTYDGNLTINADGSLTYQPDNSKRNLYVFGYNRLGWLDLLGALLFVGVLLGILGHGTLRYLSSLRHPKAHAGTQRVYMYDAYERFWHWLQMAVIVLLLFTGLIIHRPDIFGIFSFRYVVLIHNILAALLALNAALSLFWHLTNGEIRQYIPRPRGFIDDAIEQAKYYISGIFKGEPHPFAKRRDKKFNPLQQLTYFGLLNVLLPLQGLTGILMWAVQKVPSLANLLGGLPVLAPIHSLIAWLFASFIVGHVYLTTTGATPLEAIRAMITGWEEVEVHEEQA
jgi:thiosulfate reductase cytochrome b subunit/cytochrome c553